MKKIVLLNGTVYWWCKKNKKIHREDGPAIIYSNGKQYWLLNGKEYKLSKWVEKVAKLKGITKEEVMAKYVLPYML